MLARFFAITPLTLLLATSVLAQQPRFPQLKLEDTSGAQKTLAERMIKETRVGLGGPWNIMLRSPAVGGPLVDLYHHFRWDSKLGTRLVEFAICITAREAESPYEWFVHYPLAVKEGVSETALADIKAGRKPSALKADESAAYEFAIELMHNHVVSDATFARAKSLLGEQGVVDLTGLVGSYYAIAGMLNVSEVWGDEGTGPAFLPKPAPKK